MPKVSDEYRESRRREIAESALRVFNRKGFRAASMADIIAESGASAGAIYGSYKGKADIVHAVATTLINERLHAGIAFLNQDPLPEPGALVGVMMRGMLETLDSSDVLVQLWGEAVTDPDLRAITNEIMDRIETVYVSYLERWHEETGLSPAEARRLATRLAPIFVSVSQGFIVQSALRSGFDADEYLSAAAEFLPR